MLCAALFVLPLVPSFKSGVLGMVCLIMGPVCLAVGVLLLCLDFFLYFRTDGVSMEYCLYEVGLGMGLWPKKGRVTMADVKWLVLRPGAEDDPPLEKSASVTEMIVHFVSKRWFTPAAKKRYLAHIHLRGGWILQLHMMRGQDELLEFFRGRFPDRVREARNLLRENRSP